MKGLTIYSDSNKKDINGAIVISTVILFAISALAFFNDRNNLLYSFLGINVVLVLLLKRAQYNYSFTADIIEKTWKYRSKKRLYTLKELDHVDIDIKTSFPKISTIGFTIVVDNKLKRVNMMTSKPMRELEKLIEFLSNHSKVDLELFHTSRNGKTALNTAQVLQILKK